MDKYKKIVGLFEDFYKITGTFLGEHKFFNYVAPDSMHSGITKLGYGTRLELPCVDISQKELNVSFSVGEKEVSSKRFYVRLTACMPEWKKYYNNLKIQVNGVEIYNKNNTLFENVCVGWPVSFYPFSSDLLKVGSNIVTVSTSNYSNCGLYVANVDLLSLPSIKDGMQISSIRYARINQPFTIALFGTGKVALKTCKNVTVQEVKRSTIDSAITLLKCVAKDKKVSLSILYNGQEVPLLCPVIVDESDDYFCVGIDNDDYRQDYTEEADRIPMIFTLTGMGNFFQFRPSLYRSVAEFPDDDTWKRRAEWLLDFNTRLSICNRNASIDFLADINPSLYEGKHCHETYLYFSNVIRATKWGQERFFIDTEKIEKAKTFGECKKLYLDAVEKMYQQQKSDKGTDSVGAPSLLVVYEASKFQRLTMEPVSGVNLLLGATRAASNGKWGAHIPISWYYGYYNDIVKARKYRNTMFYCYLNGADYVYAENGLFKSQSMSREDWDTEFSIANRQFTREMYDYSICHPRCGELQIPFACVYGNNEFMLWQKDSRIAELEDSGDWDLNVWGKWKESNTYLCWRAIDAWLPVAANQNTVDDKFNLSLHSGTTFGSVDILPYEKDYSKYKFIVFLGWNTYEDSLSNRLYDYINNGGNVLISYCHFNKTDCFDKEFEYASDSSVQKLLGFSEKSIESCVAPIIIDGEVYQNDGGVKIVIPKNVECEPLCYDEQGNVILYRRKIGKGYLYFCTFANYYGTPWAVNVMKKMLKNISYTLCSSYCDNDNIAYTEHVLENGKRVFHFINMSSALDEKQSFTINVKQGEKFYSKSMDIGVCEIKELTV